MSSSPINDLFWIFMIFILSYPAIQKRMLYSSRLRLLRSIEKKRNSRVITLIHRQEVMTFLGFPIMRFINIEDSEEILRAIRMTPPEMPIDLILHTPGGLVLATEQIAQALKNHKATVTVFIPHYAMSGGTLIALAADQIVMDPNAVLGPVDPQLGEYPAASVLKILKSKNINEIDDKTLIMADLAEKAIKQVKDFVLYLLEDKMDNEKANKIASYLVEGHFTHDYPLTVRELEKLGLPINTEMPKEIYDYMSLFHQASTARPTTVEYIPMPYIKPKGRKK